MVCFATHMQRVHNFLNKNMLSIVILCDVNRNVNINNHEDIFGISNTKWGLVFSQFNKIKIRTNIIILESFSSNQNCTHALYRINVIPIRIIRLPTSLFRQQQTSRITNPINSSTAKEITTLQRTPFTKRTRHFIIG